MKILVRAPISPFSGYGNDGIGIVQTLQARGHDVYLQPTHVDPPLPRKVSDLLTKELAAPFDLAIVHVDPGQLGCTPEMRRNSACVIGWTMWEYSSLSNLRGKSTLRKRLKPFDAVVAYDHVAADALRPYLSGDTALLIQQGGYDPAPWTEMERDWFDPEHFGFCMNGALHAQPLDSKVLTPTGWTSLGAIAVGDEIIDPEGGTQKVDGVSARTVVPVYEVVFQDGSRTRSTADHLWRVDKKSSHNRFNSVWRDVSLQTLLADTLVNKAKNLKYRVPTAVVDFQETGPLPLDPYLVGVLCGDGCISQVSITITNVDEDCLTEVRRVLPVGTTLTQKRGSIKQWSITGIQKVDPLQVCVRCGALRRHNSRSLCSTCVSSQRRAGALQSWPLKARVSQRGIARRLLTEAGFGREVCPAKFVPAQYLFAPTAVRLSVLQGLMDSDGWNANSGARFGSSSPGLVDAVEFLVRSLGGVSSRARPVAKKYPHKGETRTGRTHQEITVQTSFNPFRMARKAESWRPACTQDVLSHRIKEIRAAGVSEVQCLTVSGSGTYVTDDFIVTHNSRKDPMTAIQAFRELKTEYPQEFEPAEMHLHTVIPGLHPAMEEWCPKLRIHYAVWPVEVLRAFYKSQHVLLAPSRGEGKNLPALEMLSTGGTVIATNWGGMSEWLSTAYAYPLRYVLRAEPGHPDCFSARADKDHLKELMLHVFRNRGEARERGALAARTIPAMCSWESVVERLLHQLRKAPNGERAYTMAKLTRVPE